MTRAAPWTFGVELELLAPPGATRADVARALGDDVARTWHLASEPSHVPGQAVFHNLSPAFRVRAAGRDVATVTDDLTLVRDLDRRAPPKAGWLRIVSDDVRLLRVVARHAPPDAPLADVLEPVRALFGGRLTTAAGGLVRLEDPWGSPIAIAAPLPGERERGCELAMAPATDLADVARVCEVARAVGCVVPHEAAVHVHVDGAAVADAATLHRLAQWVDGREAWLRALVGTNPACVRLGAWPEPLRAALLDPAFAALPWDDASARLRDVGVSKYVDLNLRNLVHPSPGKHTLEWRIFPGMLDAEAVAAAVHLMDALVTVARDPRATAPHGATAWLAALPLPAGARAAWQARLP